MRVVVLGGSPNQEGCVHAARRLGAEVIVVDPRSGLSGTSLADRWIQCDAGATSEIVEALGGTAVDAVFSDQSDYTARASSELARALGVKGQDPELIAMCTNKWLMRERIAAKAPDLVPNFWHFSSPRSAMEFARDHRAPLVVKPPLSQGSRGVSFVRSAQDLPLIDRAFDESGGLGVLLEDAVIAPEYSVDGYVSQGIFTPRAIAGKAQYEGNGCLDERIDYLPSRYETAEGELLTALSRIVAALGIEFGIVHAELFVQGDRVTLVEIALRGGGSCISSVVVPYLTGFDPAEALLRDLLEIPQVDAGSDYRTRSSILRFLPMTPHAAPDLASAEAVDGCLKIVLAGGPMPDGRPPRSSEDRPGFIVIGRESESDALRSEAEVLKRLGYLPSEDADAD